MLTFTNLTRAPEIGANSYLLEADGTAALLDAGMHPRLDGWEATPLLDRIPKKLGTILVSHAHHDHIGSLPLVTSAHSKARVWMTSATSALAEPLLHNSVNVMTRERREKGNMDYPLYTHRGVDDCVVNWEHMPLQKPLRPDGSDLEFILHDAGHVLGSVLTEIRYQGKRALYTGDINLQRQTLMLPSQPPPGPIDTVIMETTRGSQAARPEQDRTFFEEELLSAIRATFERGGAVLMPVFAMGKTQEMLALLHQARLTGKIPPAPIYIGGLGRALTEVYDRQRSFAPRQQPGLRLIAEVQPETFDPRRIPTLRPRGGHIYLVSSGMMTPHTTSHSIARLFFPREHDSIFFVGYTEPSSPAGLLRAASQGGSVEWGDPSGPLPVKCQVRYFDLTAHSTREELVRWVCQGAQPSKVLLVHGDPEAQAWFASTLAKERPGMEIIQPPSGQAIPLF
jgi:Cft2 family RNA processing exonuclease